MTLRIGLLFCLLIISSQKFAQAAQIFDVLKYGAIGDGAHKNTEAIAKAIAAASSSGGGTVHFPLGEYLTGPIHLKSNVSLHLDDGVVVKFSDHFDDYYPMVRVRWEGTMLMNFSPLIYGANVSNVAITGSGNATFDGNGQKWWDFSFPLKEQQIKHGTVDRNNSKWSQEFFRVNAEVLSTLHVHQLDIDQLWQGFLRPQFFHTLYSDHITLEGVTFVNSPFWFLHPTFTDYVTINRVNVIAPPNIPNTDGIDPDSCRFVEITNCFVSVGDDCIAIKSGKNEQGRAMHRPSENITITDTILQTRIGFAIGSEMSGSVRNVVARNLTFIGSRHAFLIKSVRGRGGVIENIHISDVVMHGVFDTGIVIYGSQSHKNVTEEGTPVFRNIHFDNVVGDAKLAIRIEGLPESTFENIELTNVHIASHEKDIIKYAHVIETNVTTH